MKYDTRGRVALAAHIAATSRAAIAARTNINADTLGKYASGDILPRIDKQIQLEERLGIACTMWTVLTPPAAKKPPVHAGPHTHTDGCAEPPMLRPSRSPALTESRVDAARTIIEDQLRRLAERISDELRNPECSDARLAKLFDLQRKAAERLGKYNDEEGAADERRFLRSGKWSRLKQQILASVANCPHCMKSLVDALKDERE